MSITLKVVDLLDRLNVQSYFVEKENKLQFTPIKISFDFNKFEKRFEKLTNINGNSYRMNQFEKDVLRELDF
jgi:two-component SAPR family response regulator